MIRQGQRVFVRDLWVTGKVKRVVETEDGAEWMLVVRLDRKVRGKRWAHVPYERVSAMPRA